VTDRTKEQKALSRALIEKARGQGFGYDTSVPAARLKSQVLHAAGCSLVDIATLFGVSSEQARMWVRGMATKPLTEPEWQLVKWLRSNKMDPANAQAALVTLQEQYADLGRR
jgi:hypothetical protein